MFQYADETWKVGSMDELLALARSMEQEAIDGYMSLSRRMNEMGRHDMAVVFDSLVEEERGHLGKVEEWRDGLGRNEATVPPSSPEEPFDDEGAGIVAPELLSAYRAFSMAVRNEERAFVFWSYVSAHAQSVEIRKASERMAREELGHVATLRRERRRAFHVERGNALESGDIDLASLEARLSGHLNAISGQADPGRSEAIRTLEDDAGFRARSMVDRPFGTAPLPDSPPRTAVERALPLCEFLLDCYLDIGDRAMDEQDADRARTFAEQIIHCLKALRSLSGSL